MSGLFILVSTLGFCLLVNHVLIGRQFNRMEKKIDAAWHEICNLSEVLAKVISRKST